MSATYYQIRPNGGTDEALWLTVAAGVLPQAVGSLAAGSYQVRALGASAWSSAVTVTAAAAAPASAPVVTTVTPQDTSASVTFTYAGDDATAFEYQINGGTWTATGRTTPGTFTISGLTASTAYTVAVRATNATGAGPASTPATEFSTTATATLIRFNAGTGGLPASMSTPWNTDAITYAQDPAGYLLVTKTGSQRTAAAVTAVSFADGEVTVKFRAPTRSGTSIFTLFGIGARIAGGVGTDTGVAARVTRNSGTSRILRGLQYDAGVATSFGSDFGAWDFDVWYIMRMQVSGGTQRIKIWPAADAEPAGWTSENVDAATVTDAGNPGLIFVSGSAAEPLIIHVEWIGWSDGGVAPLG